MKKVCILGSTGSIGRNALRVISGLSGELQACGLSANSNIGLLAAQANEFRPRAIAITEESGVRGLRKKLSYNPRIFAGEDAHSELAKQKDADMVLVAIAGGASIRPVYSAVSRGKDIALASKEALVSAGHIIMKEAKSRGAAIIPVDSEHSALFQCLRGNEESEVRRLYITSSGGPLLRIPKRRFKNLSLKDVLDHPKWKMGRKISVDSATMMNKGLEVIEAKWLFGIDVGKIEVLIHPEAVVHSMVEFIDGALLAQLGVTDMRIPIQYALTYPARRKTALEPLDLVKTKQLTFAKPDTSKFPLLKLAYEAARIGGSAPSVLNASNEAAVNAFLAGSVKFTDIPRMAERALSRHKVIEFPSLGDIDEIGKMAKEEAGIPC